MEQEIRPLTPNEILRGWLDSLPRKDYNKTKHLLVDACLVPLHTVNNWVYGNCSIRPASQRDINRVSLQVSGKEIFNYQAGGRGEGVSVRPPGRYINLLEK